MDNTRLFLFAALVFTGMLLWQQWEADYGPRAQQQPPAQVSSGEMADPLADDLPITDDLPAPTDEVVVTDDGGTTTTTRAATSTRLLRVDTDVVQALIDTRGGVIRSLKLKQYPISLEEPDEWLELIHSEADTLHIMQSGLVSKEQAAPTHHSLYSSEQTEYRLADGADELMVPLTWEKDGLKVTKTYRFRRGDYLVDVIHALDNNSAGDWQGSQYRQITRARPLETSRILYTYTGAVYFNEEVRYEKLDFDDMEDSNLSLDSEGGWIAMIQHYFLSAWIPNQDETNFIYSIANTKQTPSTYAIGMRSKSRVIPAGGNTVFESQLFAGPKLPQRLEEISPSLELTVDFGVLTFLSKPLYWLLSWYHGFVANWGLAIILLVFTVKAIFYKLSEASYRSMAKMRKVSPRLQTLKERYGDDRQRMNQEMMKMYKEEKINPLGGCLPILIQIPVFIALYWALLESVELRQAPFILWIEDLSVRDPFFVLPILMGISMVIQQRLNPPPPDPIQAKIMMALPFVFTVFFAFFPAGLVLYWVVNNVLSIAQQWVITKRIEAGGK